MLWLVVFHGVLTFISLLIAGILVSAKKYASSVTMFGLFLVNLALAIFNMTQGG